MNEYVDRTNSYFIIANVHKYWGKVTSKVKLLHKRVDVDLVRVCPRTTLWLARIYYFIFRTSMMRSKILHLIKHGLCC